MTRYHRISVLTLACIVGFLLVEKPAFADSPVFWGLFGSLSTGYLTFFSGGLALAGVVLIEWIVFGRMLSIGWSKSLLVVACINFISAVAGVVFIPGFSVPCPCLLSVPLLIIVIAILCIRRNGLGRTLAAPGIIFSILGFLGIIMVSGHSYPISKVLILPLIWTPLLMGFGITLMVEGRFIRDFSIGKEGEKAVLVANIASYLFLAVLMIFYGPNPYNTGDFSQSTYQIGDRIINGMDKDQILDFLHDRHATNLSLLGLGDGQKPSSVYDQYELQLLEYTYSRYYGDNYLSSEVGIAIANYGLTIPGLSEAEHNRFYWFIDYLTFRSRFEKEIKAHKWGAVESILVEWKTWLETNPYPKPFSKIITVEFSPDRDVKFAKDRYGWTTDSLTGN